MSNLLRPTASYRHHPSETHLGGLVHSRLAHIPQRLLLSTMTP